jgi:hypothetical protein
MPMADFDTPITVQQLMNYLKQYDQNAIVMVECEDEYYSGLVKMEDLFSTKAAFIEASDGNFRGWYPDYDGKITEIDAGQRVFARKPCLLIHVGRRR